MIENSWAWAQKQGPGRFRINEIHGEEEIKIVLFQGFDDTNAQIEEVERKGQLSVEEGL